MTDAGAQRRALSAKPSRHPQLILLIAVAWALLGTVVVVLAMYIPDALDVVDDEPLGHASVIVHRALSGN